MRTEGDDRTSAPGHRPLRLARGRRRRHRVPRLDASSTWRTGPASRSRSPCSPVVGAVLLATMRGLRARAQRARIGVRPSTCRDRAALRARCSSTCSRTRWSRARRALQPDARERLLLALHADRDDGRRGRSRPDRAALPGLDLLGLPPAASSAEDSMLESTTRSTCCAARPGPTRSHPPADSGGRRPSSARALDRRLLRGHARRARRWRSPSSWRRRPRPRRRAGDAARAASSRASSSAATRRGRQRDTPVALAVVVAARGLVRRGLRGGRAARRGARHGRRCAARLDRPHAAARARAACASSGRGELVATAVQGVDALEAYFARYLPQLVLVGRSCRR